jgi:mono/diheme cytochrome c family protein
MEEVMRQVISAFILGIAFLPVSASAQSVGEAEYMNSCAACHGPKGLGGGSLAGFLTGSLPDLTQLAAGNEGVFPVTKVYATIDGTMTSGAHGTREMPIWGNRYRIRGAEVANPDFQAEEAEVFARFRILALTEYLASIQR